MAEFVQGFAPMYGGFQQRANDQAQADILRNEGAAARDQALAAESQQRRTAAMSLGKSAAAAAESGTGTGGSTGAALGQAATDAEYDALVTRYKGAFVQSGYDAEADMRQQQGKFAALNGLIEGGAKLYNYTGLGKPGQNAGASPRFKLFG